MEKTTRPTSISFAQNQSCTSEKVDGGELCLEDKISALPHEILVSILSQLTMKEAARTCVLSKKWRFIWTYIYILNFDASDTINKIMLDEKQLEVETPLYLRWVNQVVKSFNGGSIDEFIVRFELDATCKSDIDNWVHFAIEKRVKRLELSLLEYPSPIYDFPETCHITSHLPLGFTSYNSLTSLVLQNVNVTGQVVEYFLTNCPLLENLSVDGSDSLVNLKVPILSRKLKRLSIFYCFSVESIEIYATNLVSFAYFGPKISLPFKDVQQPVEVFIGGEYCRYLIHNLCGISSYFSQLECLTLDILYMEEILESPKFPIFNKVKQLELHIYANDYESLLVFAPLIEACPFLHKFVVQLILSESRRRRKPRRPKIRYSAHQYLKVVEFIGWIGLRNDFDLARYLIKSATMLEKITLNSCQPPYIGGPWEFEDTDERKAARKRANYFRIKLPAGVVVTIV